jgi:hypothetical protein
VLQKGDKMDLPNYKGIGVLNVAYKILSKLLCNHLNPYANVAFPPAWKKYEGADLFNLRKF